MATDHELAEEIPESQFPPTRVTGWGRGWYRGDCHVHSTLSSGGELTPAQLATAAREAGLDFIATTEHNTSEAHGRWGPYAGDDLLVILGQKATTPIAAGRTTSRCPVTARVSTSGIPTRRNPPSSASRYATPEGTWRRSPTPSS